MRRPISGPSQSEKYTKWALKSFFNQPILRYGPVRSEPVIAQGEMQSIVAIAFGRNANLALPQHSQLLRNAR